MEKNAMPVGRQGFTLIELLIVVTILAVIATIVVAVIQPREQLAKTRDAGRITAVSQLGHAVDSYLLANNVYPDAETWDEDLIANGQPATFPDNIEYIQPGVTGCSTNGRPTGDVGFCYNADILLNNAIVFSILESKSQTSKCPGHTTYFVFSTADGQAGIICRNSDPIPWEKGMVVYIN